MSNWHWYCFDCKEEIIDFFDNGGIQEVWYRRWFHKLHNTVMKEK